MAKKKDDKPKNKSLDDILFQCRNILRQAKGAGSFFEKRDMISLLIAIKIDNLARIIWED